jgi:hypothetical protein
VQGGGLGLGRDRGGGGVGVKQGYNRCLPMELLGDVAPKLGGLLN